MPQKLRDSLYRGSRRAVAAGCQKLPRRRMSAAMPGMVAADTWAQQGQERRLLRLS